MSKDEAIAAMQAGDKVSHRLFSPDEFIYYDKDGILRDEKDYNMKEFWHYRRDTNWNDGWSIYKSK